MAKKKDKPQVINNIGELNLEIDYDKLAKAIVRCRENDEKSESNKFMTKALVVTICLVLRLLIAFIVLLLLVIALKTIIFIQSCAWDSVTIVFENVLNIIFEVIVFVFLAVYCYLLEKSAKEIEQEKDKNFIVAVFSGIVSFAALIVALVALFKGVG